MRILRSTSRRFDRTRTHRLPEYRPRTPKVQERVKMMRPSRGEELQTASHQPVLEVRKPSRN